MGMFDGWEDTESILKKAQVLLSEDNKKPEINKNDLPAQVDPKRTSSQDVVETAKALKPFAKIDSTKVAECVNSTKEIAAIYADITNHFNSEAEQTNRTRIEAMSNIINTYINAAASVQQSYNHLEEFGAECDKEIEIKKIDDENSKRKHEELMKMLKDAKDAFDKILKDYELKLKDGIKQENEWLQFIKENQKSKKVDKFIDSFLKLKEANNKVLDFISDLRIQLSSLPEA